MRSKQRIRGIRGNVHGAAAAVHAMRIYRSGIKEGCMRKVVQRESWGRVVGEGRKGR